MRFTDLTGLAGLALVLIAPTVALVSAILRRFQKPAAQWILLSVAALLVLVCLPITNIPLLSYLRALTGDLSIPSVLLLARYVLRHLGPASLIYSGFNPSAWVHRVGDQGSSVQGKGVQGRSEQGDKLKEKFSADDWFLRILILCGAVVLYPLTLGISAYDPYRWGFSNQWFLAVLLVLALVAWHRQWHWSASCIALAVLAHAIGWNESTNLWTYLIDPMLAVYAFVSVMLGLLRASKFGWHSLALWFTALAWLFLGLLQRQPWKADEAYSFGVVYSMIDGGHWLIPTLAGEAFVEKPPLMFWLAALCAKALGSLLSPHEAARIAVVLAVLFSFAVLALAGHRAGLGRRGMIATVLLLAAAPSVLFFSRYLTADVGLFPGAALASLGLVALFRGDRDAGVLLGLGAAVGLLSKGLLLPGALGCSVLTLIGLVPALRNRAARTQYGIAALVFLVVGFAWPLALYQQSPTLFGIWFWDNNFGRFLGDNRLGPPNDRLAFMGAVAASFLPLWPLVLVALYRKGITIITSPLLGPLLFGIFWVAILLLSQSARSGYALPALAPLALLAAAALESPSEPIRRKLLEANWLRWLIIWLAAALLLLIIALKSWYLYQQPTSSLGSPLISKPTLLLVGLMLLAWILALRSGYKPRVLTLWVSGLSLVFALAIALFLPGADRKTGFREVFGEIAKRVNPHAGCVASRGLGESERGMLHYYTGIHTLRYEVNAELAASCSQWIEQQRVVDDASKFGCSGATELWAGGRAENTFDTFRVCRR